MINLTFDSEDALKTLLKLEKGIDANQAAEDAAAIVLSGIRRRYLKEQDPDGRQWPKSFAATERAATGRGGGTLYDTGDLFRSIQLVKVANAEYEIKTDVPYAAEHQLGIGQVKREYLGTNQEEVNLAAQLYLSALFKRVSQ
jgi:phage gpG-like protein